MKVALLLIYYFSISIAILALPHVAGGAILRLIFRSVRPGLVALLAAILILTVADIFTITPFLSTFRTVLDLNSTVLSDANIDSTSTVLLITLPAFIGGFLGTVSIPFLLAYGGVRLVDKLRKSGGPNNELNPTNKPAAGGSI